MLDDILRKAVEAGASDVHINAGLPPLFRINTVVQRSPLPVVSEDHAERLGRNLLEEKRWAEFEKKRDREVAYLVPNLARFRINVHYQRGTVAMSVRIIANKVRPLEALNLPPIVEKLTHLPRGLILVTGPTGSGKSTTLAAMIDAINRRDKGHIITLEDPIEYLLTGDQCVIEQREVGVDVPDFASGLRHVLRQDPDTILVGEMRDLETTRAAITAAETGHLVLSTLHTVNAPQTVARIIDIYPAEHQAQIRSMLATTLQAVVSQTLIRRADGQGMVAAVEVMVCNSAVRNCIRENRIFEIPNIIETSRAQGMQSLDLALNQMVLDGKISKADAQAHAVAPEKVGRPMAAAAA